MVAHPAQTADCAQDHRLDPLTFSCQQMPDNDHNGDHGTNSNKLKCQTCQPNGLQVCGVQVLCPDSPQARQGGKDRGLYCRRRFGAPAGPGVPPRLGRAFYGRRRRWPSQSFLSKPILARHPGWCLHQREGLSSRGCRKVLGGPRDAPSNRCLGRGSCPSRLGAAGCRGRGTSCCCWCRCTGRTPCLSSRWHLSCLSWRWAMSCRG